MGGIARVALPVAASFAAPHAGSALELSTSATAAGTAAAIIGGLQREADESSFLNLESVGLRRRSLLEASRPKARSGFPTFQKYVSPFINLLD